MVEQKIVRNVIPDRPTVDDIVTTLRGMDILSAPHVVGIVSARVETYATRTMLEVRYNVIKPDGPAPA